MPVMSRCSSSVVAAAMLLGVTASPEGSGHGCEANGTAGVGACSADVDEVGLLQFLKATDPVLGVTVSSGSCSGGNADPYATGTEVACCSGLQKCLGDWHNSGTWSYLCLESCGSEPGPAPSTSGLSICPKVVSMDKTSIWNVAGGSHSCKSSQGIRGDAGHACADSSGVVDGSSIYVNMEGVANKVGCFVWETNDCEYQMKSVKQIDFDVEWKDCSDLWTAPLWTFSDPWAPGTDNQGLSGEIDFVEECPVPTMNTNLGCYAVPELGAGCSDAKHWGAGSGSDGPKHMTATLDTEGNLDVQLCSIDKTGCKSVASYKNYLSTVYPTSDGRNNAYKFVSNIFNDHGGDGGWGGCKAVQNPSTTCKYAVTNIRIESNSDVPVFSDPHSKCYALNAEASIAKLGSASAPRQAQRSQRSQGVRASRVTE